MNVRTTIHSTVCTCVCLFIPEHDTLSFSILSVRRLLSISMSLYVSLSSHTPKRLMQRRRVVKRHVIDLISFE
jgi:hypothetical protein